MSKIVRIQSISQVHHILGLDKPKHPLVSVIPIDERMMSVDYGDATYVFDFYQISLKSGISGCIRYGRNRYDFEEGAMVFTKPGQAMSFNGAQDEPEVGGWTLIFHPDLIRQSDLGQKINHYRYFDYDVHEALHVSDVEKNCLTEISQKIKREYQQSIDTHTQKLIVANIKLMLDYCERYYDRQFYVRANLNRDVVSRFEGILRDYFEQEQTLQLGLPTVKYCGEQLSMSPSYLSELLVKETGKNARQHIQDNIIDRAKMLLLGSNDQVRQVAFGLGFEYPQHFSKFFKAQTGMTPAEYRRLS